MKPEIKEKWVKALRSGEYQQGIEELRTPLDDDKALYCCLGVLCDLASKEGVGEWDDSEFKVGEYRRMDALPSPVMEWAGLPVADPAVEIEGNGVPLSCANDGIDDSDGPLAKHSFAEIADLIEAQL